MNLQKVWQKFFGGPCLPALCEKDVDEGFDIRMVVEGNSVKFYAKATGKNKFYPKAQEICVLSKSLKICAQAEKITASTGEVITAHGKRCTRRMNLYVRITAKNGSINMATQRIATCRYLAEEAGNFVT